MLPIREQAAVAHAAGRPPRAAGSTGTAPHPRSVADGNRGSRASRVSHHGSAPAPTTTTSTSPTTPTPTTSTPAPTPAATGGKPRGTDKPCDGDRADPGTSRHSASGPAAARGARSRPLIARPRPRPRDPGVGRQAGHPGRPRLPPGARPTLHAPGPPHAPGSPRAPGSFGSERPGRHPQLSGPHARAAVRTAVRPPLPRARPRRRSRPHRRSRPGAGRPRPRRALGSSRPRARLRPPLRPWPAGRCQTASMPVPAVG